ncbi:MAG: hypothetical protein OSJ46_06030 [Duncaniella sp.]|nr:hypothetical protein [Duncaniella sp.]HBI57561.1 hypothetical protein [Porphyromonadaceae bacterium]
MRHLLHIITLTLVAAFISAVTGCSRDNRAIATLDLADSLLSTSPDSSLALVTSIDTSALSSPAARARWALSYTIARDKNFVDETDDSLISVAARYFAQKNDTRRAMLAYYYLSLVQFNASNYTSSAVSGLRSLNYGEELRDSFWLGRICELMSRINHNTYNMPETERWINRAVEMFKAGRDTNFYFESKINQAICYTNLDDHTRAIAILDSIKPLLPTMTQYMQGAWHECYISPYLKTKQYDLAWQKITDCEQFGDIIVENSEFYSQKAVLALAWRQYDNALKYLNDAKSLSCDSTTDIHYITALATYYDSIKEPTKQLILTQTLLNLQNEGVSEAIKQSVAIAQRNYYLDKTLFQQLKIRTSRFIILLLGLILVILTICGTFFYRQHIRIKNAELEKRLIEINTLKQNLYDNNGHFCELFSDIKEREHEISRLSLALDSKASETEKLQLLVNELFASHFETLNKLGNEYYECLDGSNPQIFYRNLEKEINKLHRPDFIDNLEKIVNECRNGVIDRLKSISSLTRDEITFLTLTFAGLSPRAICLILDYKVKSIYTRRARIKEKIEKSNSEHRDFILRLLR